MPFDGTTNTKVNFVPVGTSVAYIAGLSLTQGNGVVSTLIANRPAALKILGCSLYGMTALYSIQITSNGATYMYSASGYITQDVNDVPWDGDNSRRYTLFTIPANLVTKGMSVKVTLTNAPAAPSGRTDLFPKQVSISPTIATLSRPVMNFTVVPITFNGALPAIFSNADALQQMKERVRALLPFQDVQFSVQPAQSYEVLSMVPGWLQNNAMERWKAMTWALYAKIGGGYPIIGVVDGDCAAGKFLGTVASGLTIGPDSSSMLPVATILAWVGDPASSGEVFSHEFGHESQRFHAPSISPGGQVASNPDASYPYQDGNSSTAAAYIYLRDSADFVQEIAPSRGTVGTPTEQGYGHELMGYGGFFYNQGSSDYTWSAIQKYWTSSNVNAATTALAVTAEDAVPLDASSTIMKTDAENRPEILSALAISDPVTSYMTIRNTLVAIP